MSGHACPTGCGRTAAPGQLMCRPCWVEVPKHLQDAVYQTWRAWRRAPASAKALRAYREAHDAAVGSIR
ncbi:MAG TPA: hypothetical protein VFV01_47840 [Spirillospora sp.]|nr:hypothetical protein [Spirillospora sp.]